MKATISQTREVNRTGRSKMGRSIIYVESPLYKVADKFASDHNVFGLPFKSKTWGKVCQQVTKTHIVELKKLFPGALEIKFSQTAGCRCGCSPGYIMKHEANQYGKNFWVDIEASEVEITLVRNSINCLRFQLALKNEIKAHQAVAA
jgi:hypothetical protein